MSSGDKDKNIYIKKYPPYKEKWKDLKSEQWKLKPDFKGFYVGNDLK